MTRHILIADAEIANCIPDRKIPQNPNYRYCAGWTDYEGMGISVTCVYSSVDDRYRTFAEDNMNEFVDLCNQANNEGWECIGFNSANFDDNLFAVNGIPFKTTYDLLVQARAAAGYPTWQSVPRGYSYKMEDICQATFGMGKTGDGAKAPMLWQEGKFGAVVDYCLQDVMLTKRLWDSRTALTCPNTRKPLQLPLWSKSTEPIQQSLVF